MSMALSVCGVTSFISALSLSFGGQHPLGGCWSSKDLGILACHLETAEGQAAETLGLAWSAQGSWSTLLLKGCRNMCEQYHYAYLLLIITYFIKQITTQDLNGSYPALVSLAPQS